MNNKIKAFDVTFETSQTAVTGSATLVTVNYPDDSKLKFLVDCGYFPEKKPYDKENKEFLFKPSEIEFAILTHAHMDHSGRFPYLWQNGFNKKTYMTETTYKLIPYMLRNSFLIQKNICNKDSKKNPVNRESIEGFLTECAYGVRYKKEISVGRGITLTMFRNSHIPGAAVTLVTIRIPKKMVKDSLKYKPINLLFYGDFNDKNDFFNNVNLPKKVRQMDLNVLIESTYGTTNLSERSEVFEKNILEAVAKKKQILIGVCALSRMQEVLLRLTRIQKKIKLPNIYIDGKLGLDITSVWSRLKEVQIYNFIPRDAIYVKDSLFRREILEDKTAIIVTTSGMLTYGPCMTYIPEILKNKNALIHLTSYCAEDTFGRKLLDAFDSEKTIKYKGRNIPILCDVKTTSEMSSHGTADVLINELLKFSNLKSIIINHGEPEVKNEFASRVSLETKCNNVVVLDNSTKIYINGFGLNKAIKIH